MPRNRRQKENTRKRKRVSARTASEDYSAGKGSNYLRPPEGLATFKPEAKKYRLDFMPYVVGKGNPVASEGDEFYERKFFVHKNVGPDEDWVICPAKTFKKPCPICEYLKKKPFWKRIGFVECSAVCEATLRWLEGVEAGRGQSQESSRG